MSYTLDPPKNALLRPMQYPDIDTVLRIECAAHVTPWTESTLRGCVRAGYACELFEVRGACVGFSIARVGPDDTELLNLCVDPAAQRFGHGRTLLGSVVSRARQAASQRVLLDVRVSNRAAISLYERSGFHTVGLRNHYYRTASGAGEDALVMALSLNGF